RPPDSVCWGAGPSPSLSLETYMTSEQPRTGRRTLIGTVVSDKMEKTVVVEVTRRVLHRRSHEYRDGRKKCKAHDETNAILTGAEVVIEESRPLSRTKRWVVVEERKKGTGEVEAIAGDEGIRQPGDAPGCGGRA